MNRRIKMALPLLFAFVLTLMPFGLLEYNQHQRSVIQHERSVMQWQHRAGNFLQLFKSLWSIELQIRHRQFLLKKVRQRIGISEKFTGERFVADLRTVFPAKLMPETIYAGIFKEGQGVNMFTGPGFSTQKQRFFKKVLEGLATSEKIRPAELTSLNSMVSGAFGGVLDFSLFKNHRQGKVSRIMFEGSMKLAYWDFVNGAAGSKLIFLQIFAHERTDRLPVMRLVADSLSARNPSICSVLMPLEFSDPGALPLFDAHVPLEQKQRILGLFEKISARPLERDHLVPAGKFVDYQGVRILRDFIDYAVPYEVWVLSRDNPEVTLREPIISFLLRLFFFAGWILVFCKVLISGSPMGISLKNWLALTFVVVGILPLSVFFVAGIFQIDSTAFRREQEAVKDALQQLEEADASGEVVMAEFRDACRRWTMEKDWLKSIIAWDHAVWDQAVAKMMRNFASASLDIGAVYIYPPDKAGLKDKCYVLPGPGNSAVEEQQTHDFYYSWVRKAYFRIVPELMVGYEPEMSMFHGRTGQEVLRIFQSNRGDVEFIDLGDEKQLLFQNYVLENGKPRNWFFFRFNITKIFEDYLRETIESFQTIYSENLYAIAVVDKADTKMIFPEPGSKASGVIRKAAGQMIDLAAITRSQLIEQTDDHLVVTYPCAKSGLSVVVNIVFFRSFREAAYRQELILSMVVLLMTIPVMLVSKLTAAYLVSPLKSVENGLKRIADEDYTTRLHLNRDDELGLMTRAFDQMVEGLKERRNLGRFVSAALDQQISHADSAESEGLEKRLGAVLCSDIRSFTSISEANEVRDVVEMLNEHLAAMSECVRANGGLVEQFIGDAILAVFHGKDLQTACQNAVNASVAMMRRHQEICSLRCQVGKFTYAIGIGVEAGELLSGTVVAGLRSDYTVVGAARNAAEDLELRSKEGRFTKIVVSPQVYEYVNNYDFVMHPDQENYEMTRLEART